MYKKSKLIIITIIMTSILIAACTPQTTNNPDTMMVKSTPTAEGMMEEVPTDDAMMMANSTPTPDAMGMEGEPTTDEVMMNSEASCQLSPIIVPTLPAEIPGYTQLDESTGLHMTGTYQEVDLESYRLKISGDVDHPLELTYDDLRCMPKITATPKLVCPGFFEDTATWSGVPLTYVLDMVGIKDGASRITLISADGYMTYIPLSDALNDANFLAYEWEGQPIPILHGFPVRAVFPSMQGSNWAKWLIEIQVD